MLSALKHSHVVRFHPETTIRPYQVEGNAADSGSVTRLWLHEMLRVFHDRLTAVPDRLDFLSILATSVESNLKERLVKLLRCEGQGDDGLLAGARGLLFADFMVPGKNPRSFGGQQQLGQAKLGFSLWGQQRCAAGLAQHPSVHQWCPQSP